MNDARKNELKEKLDNARKYDSKANDMIEQYTDLSNGETSAYRLKLDRSNAGVVAAIKNLEESGYQVIFPAEVSEETLMKMSEGDRITYNALKNEGLVVDATGRHNGAVFDQISEHYFSLCSKLGQPQDRVSHMGCINADNSITTDITAISTDIQEKYSRGFNEVLSRVGFNTQRDETGGVKAFCDEPIQFAKKSNFRNIYDKAKGKINETIKNFKNAFRNRNNQKEVQNDEGRQ